MTTLRSILVALGAAAALFAFAAIAEIPGGAVARAIAGVALGVGVTALFNGEPTFLAVALGAFSPLAFAAIEPLAHGAAATALCLLWLAPRFVLADTRRKLVASMAASVVAAGIAGSIFAAYADAPLAAHAASCVFAGSCLSLVGVVVQLPTTKAHALAAAAAVIDAPLRDVLLRAAEAHDGSRWQPRSSAARRNWRALVRLSDQRAAIQRATGIEATAQRRDLDDRIEGIARDLLPLGGEPQRDGANPTGADLASATLPSVTSPDSTMSSEGSESTGPADGAAGASNVAPTVAAEGAADASDVAGRGENRLEEDSTNA
jgi:hypothetical protein